MYIENIKTGQLELKVNIAGTVEEALSYIVKRIDNDYKNGDVKDCISRMVEASKIYECAPDREKRDKGRWPEEMVDILWQVGYGEDWKLGRTGQEEKVKRLVQEFERYAEHDCELSIDFIYEPHKAGTLNFPGLQKYAHWELLFVSMYMYVHSLCHITLSCTIIILLNENNKIFIGPLDAINSFLAE